MTEPLKKRKLCGAPCFFCLTANEGMACDGGRPCSKCEKEGRHNVCFGVEIGDSKRQQKPSNTLPWANQLPGHGRTSEDSAAVEPESDFSGSDADSSSSSLFSPPSPPPAASSSSTNSANAPLRAHTAPTTPVSASSPSHSATTTSYTPPPLLFQRPSTSVASSGTTTPSVRRAPIPTSFGGRGMVTAAPSTATTGSSSVSETVFAPLPNPFPGDRVGGRKKTGLSVPPSSLSSPDAESASTTPLPLKAEKMEEDASSNTPAPVPFFQLRPVKQEPPENVEVIDLDPDDKELPAPDPDPDPSPIPAAVTSPPPLSSSSSSIMSKAQGTERTIKATNTALQALSLVDPTVAELTRSAIAESDLRQNNLNIYFLKELRKLRADQKRLDDEIMHLKLENNNLSTRLRNSQWQVVQLMEYYTKAVEDQKNKAKEAEEASLLDCGAHNKEAVSGGRTSDRQQHYSSRNLRKINDSIDYEDDSEETSSATSSSSSIAGLPVSSSEQPIVVYDFQNPKRGPIVLTANKTFCDLLGYDLSEVIRMPWTKFIPPEAIRDVLQNLNILVATKHPNPCIELEQVYQHKNGGLFATRDTHTLLLGNDGTPIADVVCLSLPNTVSNVNVSPPSSPLSSASHSAMVTDLSGLSSSTGTVPKKRARKGSFIMTNGALQHATAVAKPYTAPRFYLGWKGDNGPSPAVSSTLSQPSSPFHSYSSASPVVSSFLEELTPPSTSTSSSSLTPALTSSSAFTSYNGTPPETTGMETVASHTGSSIPLPEIMPNNYVAYGEETQQQAQQPQQQIIDAAPQKSKRGRKKGSVGRPRNTKNAESKTKKSSSSKTSNKRSTSRKTSSRSQNVPSSETINHVQTTPEAVPIVTFPDSPPDHPNPYLYLHPPPAFYPQPSSSPSSSTFASLSTLSPPSSVSSTASAVPTIDDYSSSLPSPYAQAEQSTNFPAQLPQQHPLPSSSSVVNTLNQPPLPTFGSEEEEEEEDAVTTGVGTFGGMPGGVGGASDMEFSEDIDNMLQNFDAIGLENGGDDEAYFDEHVVDPSFFAKILEGTGSNPL
ncbi:hypothetical protein QOT17_000293 [Balamuthia mandrillaris]